jgi:hypothetical protein
MLGKASELGNNSFVQYRLMDQEEICAKLLKAKSIITVVGKLANFICSEGPNHKEFQDFLHNLEIVFKDGVYYSEVRYLSHRKVLKQVFHLEEEKGKPVAEFHNNEWTCQFTTVVDTNTHVNKLNTCLQDKYQLIYSVSDHVKVLEIKLYL